MMDTSAAQPATHGDRPANVAGGRLPPDRRELHPHERVGEEVRRRMAWQPVRDVAAVAERLAAHRTS